MDFALGTWGSPAKDLSYLLFSSSHKTVREGEWNLLLEHYHSELTASLTLLNYPKEKPTLGDIHSGLRQCGPHICMVGLCIIGLRFLQKFHGDGLSFITGDTEADENFRIELFSNPAAADELLFLLEFLDRNGLLE